MILCTDDYPRIFEQMQDEREKVRYYLHKNRKKIDKKLRQTRTVPVWHCETLTMPKTRNTYLLYYYAMTWKEVMHGECFVGAPLLLTDNDGHRIAILHRKMRAHGPGVDETLEELQVYSGHFFSRYKERMHLDRNLTPNEVIATFFGRNGGYFAKLPYDQMVLEKNRSKSNCAWGIDDGVTLAEETDMGRFLVVKHKTFLSRAELKPGQDDATPSQYDMRAACLIHHK